MAAATKELSPSRGRAKAVADRIDSRLKLAQCSVPLQADLPYATNGRSRVTAEVRCTGTENWKLYVPVKLEIWRDVLVATGPLQKGTLLTASDVILAERAVSKQTRGFMLDPRQAIGFRLKRPLSEGDLITPGVIVAPPLIEPGQQVILEARSGTLLVRTAGVALEKGLSGDVIRVENTESGRTVQGIIRSAKTVEVLLR